MSLSKQASTRFSPLGPTKFMAIKSVVFTLKFRWVVSSGSFHAFFVVLLPLEYILSHSKYVIVNGSSWFQNKECLHHVGSSFLSGPCRLNSSGKKRADNAGKNPLETTQCIENKNQQIKNMGWMWKERERERERNIERKRERKRETLKSQKSQCKSSNQELNHFTLKTSETHPLEPGI